MANVISPRVPTDNFVVIDNWPTSGVHSNGNLIKDRRTVPGSGGCIDRAAAQVIADRMRAAGGNPVICTMQSHFPVGLGRRG